MSLLPANAFAQRNLKSNLPNTAFPPHTSSSFLPLHSASVLPAKKVCAVKRPGSGNWSKLKITCQKTELFFSRSASLVRFRVWMYLLTLFKERCKGRNRDRIAQKWGNLNQCYWQKSTKSHLLPRYICLFLFIIWGLSSPYCCLCSDFSYFHNRAYKLFHPNAQVQLISLGKRLQG